MKSQDASSISNTNDLGYFPNQLFLEITTQCNLRCKHCFMWKSKDSENKMNEEEYLSVIKEVYSINPNYSVILTGGEIFLFNNLSFSILRLCNHYNIDCVINTNGSLLDECTLNELLNLGSIKLVFSLDSSKSSLHDFMRGKIGTFDNVISSINCILKLRTTRKTKLKVYISTILSAINIFEIDEIVSLTKSLGVDGITFQLLIPSFYSDTFGILDRFYDKYSLKNSPNAVYEIDHIIELKKNDSFILNTEADLNNIKTYLINYNNDLNLICQANRLNLIVDHVGDISYCFNMHKLSLSSIGNIRENKISDLLFNEASLIARKRMSYCSQICGILNCNK